MRGNESETLVVGAGPVGQFAALSLARREISVRIVDAQWRTASRSYALALHPRSIELLEDVGALPALQAQARRVDRIVLHTGGSAGAELDYTRLPDRHPYLLVLPQAALEGILEERLKALGAGVEWSHRAGRIPQVDSIIGTPIDVLGKFSSGYSVSKTEWGVERSVTHRSSFVIGADGHRSMARRSIGAEFVPAGETEIFAVFEFECASGLPAESHLVFDSDGVAVFWPMPGGRGRWGFQMDPSADLAATRNKSRLSVQVGDEAYPWLDAEMLKGMLARRAPWFGAKIGEVVWATAVRFEKKIADRLGDGRIWLAGDSAHVGGPVGVHSMNMGFREVRDLAERIHRNLRQGAPAATLQDYGMWWGAEWRRNLGISAPAVVEAGAPEWIGPLAAKIPACIPASGTALQGLLAQIGLRIQSPAGP